MKLIPDGKNHCSCRRKAENLGCATVIQVL